MTQEIRFYFHKKSFCLLHRFNFSLLSFCFQLTASDGVQESAPVTVTITILDANDNTPTFSNVSYSINLFTDMMPGEAVLQVHTIKITQCTNKTVENVNIMHELCLTLGV